MKKTIFAGLMAVAMSAVLQINAQDKKAETKEATKVAKEEHVVAKGVKAGKWTQDYEAALAYAAEKKLPILINFTGSDWCGWCKIMEKNVFTKPEWSNYAKDSVVMVFIDFPTNKSLVPKEYVARNNELKTKFGVRGFPSYVMLDSNGKDEIGRLGAGKTKTPASVKGEVEALLRFTDGGIEKTAMAIGNEGGDKYRKLNKKIKSTKEALKKSLESAKLVEAQLKALAADLEKEMTDLRISALSAEKKAEYNKLKESLKDANGLLKAFIDTKPQRSKENMAKYQKLSQAVQDINTKMSTF